jgi:hypothetical protein
MIQFVWWSFGMALTPLALGLVWRLITAAFAWGNTEAPRSNPSTLQQAHVQPVSCSLSSSSISISGFGRFPESGRT